MNLLNGHSSRLLFPASEYETDQRGDGDVHVSGFKLGNTWLEFFAQNLSTAANNEPFHIDYPTLAVVMSGRWSDPILTFGMPTRPEVRNETPPTASSTSTLYLLSSTNLSVIMI